MTNRPDPSLRQLDIELPASPAATLRLTELLADEDTSVPEVADVIEGDLALASAVVRTVNSAMFGILRRVETVAEAVLYLGMREVAAITLELGLRTRFPPSPAMTKIWDAARLRGLLMGRTAVALGLHAWRAQSAGLFAESGQAVLCLHAPDTYPAMLARHAVAADFSGLLAEETAAYGVSHELLGASLCRAWGLAGDVADYVRERPHDASRWSQRPQPVRALLVLGAVADALIAGRDAAAVAQQVAPAADLDAAELARAATQHWQRINDASNADD
ncbi:HDOD domain-containing protein [Ideonella sp.]|uniref:HDOD domain-containing protein n=1 Tax=Ideonella sp. TaxID=1929293 RepID=UPI002B483EDE|nr:HDOD domain-containing protein [Ideonella sp.]HJV69189.1 HDOD domain-containing protein [Ideonella sp.]